MSGRANSCAKQPYPTQAAARAALAKHGEKYQGSEKKKLRVYPCDICPAWHLTHKYSGKKVPPWDKNPNWVRPGAKTPKRRGAEPSPSV